MTDEPGPLIASGRAADVFDLGDGTVLRRYRDGHHDVDLEARIMGLVAEHGYPVPTVHSVDGNDIVMDRIEGPTMMESLAASPWKMVPHARLLARLQRRLAQIEAPDWLLADTADRSHAHSVLHLDMHPMNVIMSPNGPVVIDWTNAAGGPAGFDAAITYVEVTTFGVESSADRVGQWLFSRTFRRSRGRRLVDAYLEAACEHRLADRNVLPDERIAIAALRKKARRTS
ncbi:phosphotransferase [Ilumatobacter nonamiensis]|uniref:phosphotransferase n=1 Tax=Ilumatobacter nonamiensis TaxID=467093 RepID=UPI000347ED39|nr:phosphotransferase [Ilumatobacter nonamiensis]